MSKQKSFNLEATVGQSTCTEYGLSQNRNRSIWKLGQSTCT